MDSMKIKYVVLDMDGTLLNSKNKISQINYNEIQRIKKQNVRVIICSGRHFNEILPYANLLGLTSEDYVISCDGEYIFKCDGTKIWSSANLSISEVKYISNCLKVDTFSIITDHLNIHIIKSFYIV